MNLMREIDMQTLDKDVNFMYNHPRHALDLHLQISAQRFHRLCNRIPIGKDDLQRDGNPQIFIPVDDMIDVRRTHTVDLVQLLGDDVHNVLNN